MVYKLNANENPFGCSPKVKDFFLHYDRQYLYADPSAQDLKQSIAFKYNIDPQNILCGAGSEDLITTLIRTFCKLETDEIIIPQHSFILYEKAAQITGSRIINVGYDSKWCINVDQILNAVTPHTKMICLDHPGNPIGTFMPHKELKRLVESIPSTVIILIDSAYAEYAYRCEGYNDGMEFPSLYPNVCVTRTLSKVYGLAGLRIGWLYAVSQVMAKLNLQRVLYKASRIAQEAAIIALSDDVFANETIDHTLKALKDIESFYDSLGILLCRNAGNFVTLKLRSDKQAKSYYDYLYQNQIVASLLNDYNLSHMVRISIGNQASMELLKQLTLAFDFDA
ncbi:MAG: hypothetical protein C0432_03395 [Candidatus Puniceispirillum sp.]|nr:hypothetical protein [Candidatus Pelagibacter sp.]MBA4283319.1 hypothetical protein [Candidatus Puniceispirillum sp.]